MKKTKLFAILIVSIFIGTSFVVFAPNISMTKAVARATTPRALITSPTDGDTVSGTVTITTTSAADIFIDGVKKVKKSTSYSWDTTSYADGVHEIRAKYRRTNEIIHVTVNNDGEDTTPPTISIGYPGDGSTIATTDVTVTWSGSDSGSGIDFYEIQLDGGAWTNKGTSTSHTYTGLAETTHTVNVRAWDVAGNDATDTVTFTVDTSVTPATKYAVLAGISNYKAISDLSYCDEDVNDWYNYLLSVGYESENIIVLGDHTSQYDKYDGLATEYNIKFHVNWLINLDCDEILFISSGHGGGDGNGNSFNCAWDYGSGENGEDGSIEDYEYEAMFSGALASKIFVFMDHCYSGGLIPEFFAACGNALYITTTCTEDGYGWDVRTYENGAWTYFFLEYSLINHFGSNPDTAMEDAFAYAAADYPYGGGDTPQEGDYYAGPFTL